MFIKTDYVELYSAKKVHFYHHKKEMRDEKYFKKQRIVEHVEYSGETEVAEGLVQEEQVGGCPETDIKHGKCVVEK